MMLKGNHLMILVLGNFISNMILSNTSFASNSKENYASVSIEMLKEAGIDFERHKTNGIDPLTFAEHLTTSGLILMPNIYWICFHGLFDFAYLLRLVSNEVCLPKDEFDFQTALQLYFPNAYDVKTLAEPWSHLQGSLSRLCQELRINRIGIQHQAGSDSLITAAAFFKLKEEYYEDKEILEENRNKLFGIGVEDDYINEFQMKGWYDIRYTCVPWMRQRTIMSRHNINGY